MIRLCHTRLPTPASDVLRRAIRLKAVRYYLTRLAPYNSTLLLADISSNLLDHLPSLIKASVFLLIVEIPRKCLRLRLIILRTRSKRRHLSSLRRARRLTLRLIKTTRSIDIILHRQPRANRAVRLTALLVTVRHTRLHATRKRLAMQPKLQHVRLTIIQTIRQLRRVLLVILKDIGELRKILTVVNVISQNSMRHLQASV